MKKRRKRQSRDAYANEILSKIIEQADIVYPEAMVNDQIESMLRDLDSRLQQQGMNLETFLQVTGQSREDVQESYREQAESVIERSLALREIVELAEIQVDEERIKGRIEEMVERFGEQAESIRSMFDTPNMRDAIGNELLQEEAYEYLTNIGKGQVDNEMIDEDQSADETDEPEEISDVPEEVDESD